MSNPLLTSTASENEDRSGIFRHVQERILRDYLDVFAAARHDSRRRSQLRTVIGQILVTDHLVFDRRDRERWSNTVCNEIVGLGPIDPPLHDPEVTEIMVNGPKRIFVERAGRIHLTELAFRDDAHLLDVVRRLVAPLGRRVDQSAPMVDARLPDGSRINAIIPPVALDGAVVTIRKFAPTVHCLSDLMRLGTLTSEVAEFLRDCVRGRLNLVVCGNAGSGKTTLLNVLSEFVAGERVITIEDAAELSLRNPHVVRLECRPGNFENRGEVPVRQLVKNALRMRPDRIVVGECRGPEAFDMLQGMNTGHDGSMTTVHANSPGDALRRLESMVAMADWNLPLRAIRDQVISAIDCVVQLARDIEGMRRVIRVSLLDKTPLAAADVLPSYRMLDLFRYRSSGNVDQTGNDVPLAVLPDWCIEKMSQADVNWRRWSNCTGLLSA